MSEEAPEQSADPAPQGGHTLVGYNERPDAHTEETRRAWEALAGENEPTHHSAHIKSSRPQGGHTLVGHAERTDADSQETAQAWENISATPKEVEIPLSAVEQLARNRSTDFFVNRILEMNDSIRRSKGDVFVPAIVEQIARAESYITAAKSGNLFFSITHKEEATVESQEIMLPSIYNYLKAIENEAIASGGGTPESKDASEAIQAIHDWAKSKLEPGFEVKRIDIKPSGDIYIITTKDGQEHHIHANELLNQEFNEQDQPPEEETREPTHLNEIEEGIDHYEDLDREDETPQEWGKFKSDGTYELLVDPAEIASKLGIDQKSLEDAASKGIAVERLMQARENPTTAEWLRRELGSNLEWAATPLPQPATGTGSSRGSLDMNDPMIRLAFEQGAKREERIETYKKLLQKKPKTLKKMLRRPGELPLKFHKLPYFGRRIGRLLLANRIYRNELRHQDRSALKAQIEDWVKTFNPSLSDEELDKKVKHELRKAEVQGMGEGLGKDPDQGVWGFGIPKRREILDYIKEHDEDVRVHNNKLRWFNRHEFRGTRGHHQSHRRDFAESLDNVLQRQKALEHGHIHPESIEPYDEISKRTKTYRDLGKAA